MRFTFAIFFVASLFAYTVEESHATVNRHHAGAHRSVDSRVNQKQTYHRSNVRCHLFR